MNSTSSESTSCTVTGGDKLSAESGGADAVCAAIEQAAAERAPGAVLKIAVTVDSAHSLAATVTGADGRVLAEQRLAISDRAFTRGSFERFAAALIAKLSDGEPG